VDNILTVRGDRQVFAAWHGLGQSIDNSLFGLVPLVRKRHPSDYQATGDTENHQRAKAEP